MSVNVGGATGLYVIGHDAAVIARLVDLLQQSDFAGPIFTREALPGTFALSAAHLDSPTEADIVFSFRWSGGANAQGAPGLIDAEGKEGAGMHRHAEQIRRPPIPPRRRRARYSQRFPG